MLRTFRRPAHYNEEFARLVSDAGLREGIDARYTISKG